MEAADHMEAAAAPGAEAPEDKPQDGWPKETGDMHLWGHHHGCEGVNDAVLRAAGRRVSPEERSSNSNPYP